MPRIRSRALRSAWPSLIAWIALAAPVAAETLPEVTVYKSATCGCCEKWVEQLREEGFVVLATDVDDVTAIKRENGIAPELSACHTAFVGGYIIEGHVPASDVRRLLAERPDVAGLAVPGMPVGSPGMEGANPEAYEVLSFGAKGVQVFSKHAP
jgi:hypothetical protein